MPGKEQYLDTDYICGIVHICGIVYIHKLGSLSVRAHLSAEVPGDEVLLLSLKNEERMKKSRFLLAVE